MSGKSIFLSILSVILFALTILALIFIFKSQPLFALVGLLLFIIPVSVRNKALDESNGGFDKIFAKYIVPVLAVIITLAAILSLALWL